jgi:LysR family transcriptional regulator, glycine cleavage system transcriptional activator
MSRPLRLSLDLLRGFRSAARHLSFTRAAQELCVTPSAISREVKTLEDQLGHPLFRRVNRALQLTAAGEELYRVSDKTIGQLDAAVDRIAGSAKVLGVTTTPAFASMWLAPRLPRFNRANPGIDVRVTASNDKPDLERDQLDVAIQVVVPGAGPPNGERLLECRTFPVCTPALARNKAHPIKFLSDVEHHVRLDYESVRDGRRMSEWNFWFAAMGLEALSPASTLHFPQYDQVVMAAVEGSGLAMGVLPYINPWLRQGVLCTPFGRASVAHRGTFFVVRRPDVAESLLVRAFVAWLWDEVKGEGEFILPGVKAGVGTRQRGNDAWARLGTGAGKR